MTELVSSPLLVSQGNLYIDPQQKSAILLNNGSRKILLGGLPENAFFYKTGSNLRLYGMNDGSLQFDIIRGLPGHFRIVKELDWLKDLTKACGCSDTSWCQITIRDDSAIETVIPVPTKLVAAVKEIVKARGYSVVKAPMVSWGETLIPSP